MTALLRHLLPRHWLALTIICSGLLTPAIIIAIATLPSFFCDTVEQAASYGFMLAMIGLIALYTAPLAFLVSFALIFRRLKARSSTSGVRPWV
ncbi:hypothetical protein G4G27_00720 [Sphingomonas sp. So64.6b]|uniref:hypothetical protein n=1 Tax=Sphingomonas sp. So64.6b TaxID=2997354 RepID=UPI0016025C23|nr:hypothetical protein [Sphingomonas sp. So64.6b]QNA82693.1 hypothetical protein G4G27_00720 [Sphingomonas sp. So64.6b]